MQLQQVEYAKYADLSAVSADLDQGANELHLHLGPPSCDDSITKSIGKFLKLSWPFLTLSFQKCTLISH